MSQVQKASLWGASEAGRKGTISQYFTTLHCPVCDQLTQLGVCAACRSDPQGVAVTLNQDIRRWEAQQDQLLQVRVWGYEGSREGLGYHGAVVFCGTTTSTCL